MNSLDAITHIRELGLAWTMGRGSRGRDGRKARLTQKWSGEQLGLASGRNLEENIVNQGTGSGVNQMWFRSLASSFSTSVTLDKCPDLPVLVSTFTKWKNSETQFTLPGAMLGDGSLHPPGAGLRPCAVLSPQAGGLGKVCGLWSQTDRAESWIAHSRLCDLE